MRVVSLVNSKDPWGKLRQGGVLAVASILSGDEVDDVSQNRPPLIFVPLETNLPKEPGVNNNSTTSMSEKISILPRCIILKFKLNGEDNVSLQVVEGIMTASGAFIFPNHPPNKAAAAVATWNTTEMDLEVRLQLGNSLVLFTNMKENPDPKSAFLNYSESGRQLPVEILDALKAHKPSGLRVSVDAVFGKRCNSRPLLCKALVQCNREILETSVFTDLTIISKDKDKIHCHKALVAGNSTELKTILEGDGNQVVKEMRVAMTTAGVTAFLDYQYYRKLGVAEDSASVCLELLQAADTYKVHGLWGATLALLEAKDAPWFSGREALNLFDYFSKFKDDNSSNIQDLVLKLFKKVINSDQDNTEAQLDARLAGDSAFRKAWMKYSRDELLKPSHH